MASSGQKLPQKEAGTFKKIVRCYESKQYKTGLKFSRQILSNSKFSDHGETLAMRGLIFNCMGRKEEAYDHVRRGLKSDIKSHVCWHVYGLLQRSDNKYEEAIKCYRNALKWDKENVQILKDLSMLQIQMRDLEGFRDTRHQLLKTRPAQRSSWVGYAISFHLLKNFEMARKVILEYRKTTQCSQKKPDTDYSELVLYEAELMHCAGLGEETLRHLNGFRSDIADMQTFLETKAQICLQLGKLAEGERLYRRLIDRNPENFVFHDSLERCLQLSTLSDRLQHYEEMQKKYPRSIVAKKIPLHFTTGETFCELIDKFLRWGLHKGMPSLFIIVRPLYTDPDKVRIIGELMGGYVESLRNYQLFDPDDVRASPEPPCTLLWALFFLAQHHDSLGNSQEAIHVLQEAIDHTPTDVQLYMLLARVYKHAGDTQEACRWMEEARSLDTADRFVNCKAVKYLLRTNHVEEAIETAALFTRDGRPPLDSMNEMQCMWFQTELALAYHRLERLGDALQKLHEIHQHFIDIYDDQFDFHSYCMRRMTLRAYVSLINMEDSLKNHPFFFRAAQTAIEIYIYLHDNPSARTGELNGPTEAEGKLSSSELKKRHRKQRKAELKAQAKAQEDKKESKPQGKPSEEDKKAEEEKKPKFEAKKLLMADNPLEEALRFLRPLQTLSRSRIEPHLLAYAIHRRRRKFLLMLQAVKRAVSVDRENGQLHANIVDFVLLCESTWGEMAEPVSTVIRESLPSLTDGLELGELNRVFNGRHDGSLEHIIYGAQVMYRLHPDSREKALSMITNVWVGLSDKTLKLYVEVQRVLKAGTFGDCTAELKTYEEKCHKVFPAATAFWPPAKKASQDPPEGPSEQLSGEPPKEPGPDGTAEGAATEEPSGEV